MGFLDHIFPPADSAAAPQPGAGESGREAMSGGAAAQFLHPKPPPPRLAPALLIRAQARAGHATDTLPSTESSKPNLNPTPAHSPTDQLQSRELVLTVGEILPHLPTEAIKPGLHDADAFVRFAIGDLSSDIGRGRATIMISKLADLCPELVHKPESESADYAIRLPLQKLVEQLTTSKTPSETERIEQKPAHIPAVPPEAGNPTPSAAIPEVPLAEMHGDLVGFAATPVWLDPVKKARESKAAKATKEGAPVKSGPTARGRRIQIARPALPPPTLAKAFAKRKNASPAADETADTRESDESATVMDHQQQHVSETVSPVQELATDESATAQQADTVEVGEIEAAFSTGETPSEISTPENDAGPITTDEYTELEALAAAVPEDLPTESSISEPVAMTEESHVDSQADLIAEVCATDVSSETSPTAAVDIEEAATALSPDETPTLISTPENDAEPTVATDQYNEPEALLTAVPEDFPAESNNGEHTLMLEESHADSQADVTAEMLATDVPSETSQMAVADIGEVEAALSPIEMSPEISTPQKDAVPVVADQSNDPEASVTAVLEKIPVESDTSAPPATIEESHMDLPADSTPEPAPPIQEEVSLSPASASPTRNFDAMVTNPPSDPQPAPEPQNVEDSPRELVQPAIPEEPQAFTAPSIPKEEQPPVFPTPPRIRPPAPPPPVLVTPAAGLREAISQTSIGETSGGAKTAHVQSSFREPVGRNASAPAHPQAEVAKPWAPGHPTPGARGENSRTSDNLPSDSGSSSSLEGQNGTDSAALGASAGVRPPSIQFPGSTFAAPQADVRFAGTHSSGKQRDMGPDSTSTPAVPVSTSEETRMPAPQSQEPFEVREVDKQQRSSHWSDSTSQMPAQSSLPTSLVAARPTPAVAVTSSPMSSRSLALFNQENLQALFMTEELLDVAGLARHVAALPGITACALFASDEAAQSGEFPPDFDLDVLREMGVQFVASANAFGGRLLGREVENVTIQGGGFSVTLFARAGLCLCVVHRARGFLPGVREKLAAVADELARGA